MSGPAQWVRTHPWSADVALAVVVALPLGASTLELTSAALVHLTTPQMLVALACLLRQPGSAGQHTV